MFNAVLLSLALLLASASAGQLAITTVAIGDVTRDYTPGSTVSFVDVKPTSGPNSDAYNMKLQLKNLGKEVSIQDVGIKVYAGSYPNNIPSDAQMLQIDTTGVSVEYLALLGSICCVN